MQKWPFFGYFGHFCKNLWIIIPKGSKTVKKAVVGMLFNFKVQYLIFKVCYLTGESWIDLKFFWNTPDLTDPLKNPWVLRDPLASQDFEWFEWFEWFELFEGFDWFEWFE